MTPVEVAVWISLLAALTGVVFLFRSRERALRKRVFCEIGEVREQLDARLASAPRSPRQDPPNLLLSPVEAALVARVASGATNFADPASHG